jgi:hypothetical protein
MLDKRNKELAQIQKEIYNNQKGLADATTEDKNLASRKYEMNQWSIGDKNDTLFVFSSLFIVLSVLILLTGLWRLNLMSAALCGGVASFFIVIFILIVIYRSNFTNVWRDKRYWNRRTFEGKYGKIPMPLCPGALSGIESEFSSVENSIKSGIASAGTTVSMATASATQSVANEISSIEQKARSI